MPSQGSMTQCSEPRDAGVSGGRHESLRRMSIAYLSNSTTGPPSPCDSPASPPSSAIDGCVQNLTIGRTIGEAPWPQSALGYFEHGMTSRRHGREMSDSFGGAAPQSWSTEGDSRIPRAPRPSYSEEQKFFIMFARIVQDKTWPDIEDKFSDIFGTDRSKGGLTSVYYRQRKIWGLEEVSKSSSWMKDKQMVHQMARNFSQEFLRSIDYSC